MLYLTKIKCHYAQIISAAILIILKCVVPIIFPIRFCSREMLSRSAGVNSSEDTNELEFRTTHTEYGGSLEFPMGAVIQSCSRSPRPHHRTTHPNSENDRSTLPGEGFGKWYD